MKDMSSKYCLLAILLCVACNNVWAQTDLFYNPGGERISLGKEKLKTSSIATGDLNSDGFIDVVVANGRHWAAQNEVYVNNGEGMLNSAFDLGHMKSTSYAAEVGDLDGDGDLDIAEGNDKALNRLYINDGSGVFKEKGTFGSTTSPTRNLTLADIDQDGDLDILVTNRGSKNEICLNNGIDVFKDVIYFGEADDSTIDVDVFERLQVDRSGCGSKWV